MNYTTPVDDLIRRRFSCRDYLPSPIPEVARRALGDAAAASGPGPLGTRPRFALIAATDDDATALRGLGTYGFIRGAQGFLVGAATADGAYLEDFGYRMEELVLVATDLGLGSCWLGGTFSRSSFSRRVGATDDERVPAVVAVGVMRDEARARRGFVRMTAGGDRRRPWDELFFDGGFQRPLTRAAAGVWADVLESLRLAPSASNKQPWRVVRAEGAWHLFLQRTAGYRSGAAKRFLHVEDIQRVDMGIAMCHFALAARAAGREGRWTVDPKLVAPPATAVYVASWRE